MNSAEIRSKFLEYFEQHAHQKVKSSGLIPAADPTLLFTNAGMVQFKDCFLGVHDPGYRRATTCQKCVRAGGKHNDLENVGFTARHHTFFEMLGNFSFGDYFKKEAIQFAWELLTEIYKIPKDRLRITVYQKDDEAFDLWKGLGIPEKWITRLGEKDNFWAMGDTGPCGPCTEIHYDWGETYCCGRADCAPGCEHCVRYLEIWNLVFMQFNRDSAGVMHPLPKPSVDTGAGLERMAAVLQGKFSNYDSDLFTPLFNAITDVTGVAYGQAEESDVSVRVIADHLRSSTFLISDGVIPSNEGRGYVLRRILRRAIRHGKKIGQDRPFIFKLVPAVVTTMGAVYPELKIHQKNVETLISEEEARFHETLHRGMGLLEESIRNAKKVGQSVLPGDVAFKLYDTFGFPLDLISVITAEQKLSVDEAEFETLMEKQRSLSVWNKADDAPMVEKINRALENRRTETTFLGYDSLVGTSALTLLFAADGTEVKSLKKGDFGFAVFEKTPFYAESGGQIGDKGVIIQTANRAEVVSTFKNVKTFIHRLHISEGTISVNQLTTLQVEPTLRRFTEINHTATHMLHAALRQVLGDRVKQAGSLVDPTRLRFDFTYPKALTEDELIKIEKIINDEIQKREDVVLTDMTYDDAIKSGAMAFFDEKYGDRVRVIRVGDSKKPFSVELCGGTHLKNTVEIGFFKIVNESSVASGVRRIEAITAKTAFDFMLARDHALSQIEDKLKVKGEAALKKVDELSAKVKSLTAELEKLKTASALGPQISGKEDSLWSKKIDVNGYQLVNEVVNGVNPKILRTLVDQVRDKLKEKVIVCLASEAEGKIFLCLGLSRDLTGRWDASKIIKPLAEAVGGTGGGKPDFAQAGGTKSEGLKIAFETLHAWLKENA